MTSEPDYERVADVLDPGGPADAGEGRRTREGGSVLTVAYCRVSTEEQADEGFSISGQADRLRAYAELHDLGAGHRHRGPGSVGEGPSPARSPAAPGHGRGRPRRERARLASRPSLSQPRRPDPPRRHVRQADVPLHSFTEKIDLSSATGRMFYNILGSFAQFYREQLGENVRMGTQQAVREGKWVNRPRPATT